MRKTVKMEKTMAKFALDWRSWRAITAVAAASIMLAACGGGDGDGGGGGGGGGDSAPAGHVRVYYYNKAEVDAGTNYAGWGVHNWNSSGDKPYSQLAPAWETPIALNQRSGDFAYVDIKLSGAGRGGLIVHKGNDKACASDTFLDVSAADYDQGKNVWIKHGDCTIYTTKPDVTTISLADARGYWLAPNKLAFAGNAGATYKLAVAENAGITASGATGIEGEDSELDLTVAGTVSADPALKDRFPHLGSLLVLTLSDADAAKAKDILDAQLVLARYDSGKLTDATYLQTAGVLDSLYAEAAKNETLGVSWNEAGKPVFKVWAPTAKSVKLNLYPTPFEPLPAHDGAAVAAGSLRVHWKKADGFVGTPDGSYYVTNGGWGVYSWSGPVTVDTAWPNGRIKFTATDSFGALVDIPVDSTKTKMDFLVINGNGDKACSNDQQVVFAETIMTAGQEVWIDGCTITATNPALAAPTRAAATKKGAAAKKTIAAAPVNMVKDAATGVWTYVADVSAEEAAAMKNKYYYTYTVEVFNRKDGGQIKSYTVTDPYSLSLSANSLRSMVADLDAADVKPAGWDAHSIPANVVEPEDTSIYELHVRDFSANDELLTNQAYRGKFMAFTDNTSRGMRHLKRLADAGLTTLHLLPVNDQSKINEQGCESAAVPPAGPNSEEQQAAVNAVRDADCFNWGYDPLHYTALEGSYATDAMDGRVRVREFREAVKNLHEQGLRVVIDVVYNHTPDSGPGGQTSLDKIVPDYYYRLDGTGQVTTSTCCANTATENAMMAKLTIDSAATLAKAYKLDGLRFDLMGHIPLSVMTELKTTVDAAAGRPLYYYGEGWNFGEVENNQRFVQATQLNIAGTGIGTFSDRARDAIRGGSPFDGGYWLIRNQGFINGAHLDPNGCNDTGTFNGEPCEYRDGGTFKPTSKQTASDLSYQADMVRVGLAGTLKDYSFETADGSVKTLAQINYNGQPAGYTGDPQEVINYSEKHDNQTLFDINAYKLPLGTSKADRARVQALGMSLVVLSQGVPFIHAGMDIMRSKSLDRDSFNSGDWFNRIDWGYTDNYFGMGLPVTNKNGPGNTDCGTDDVRAGCNNWPIMMPLLANTDIKPAAQNIVYTHEAFLTLLQIRKSSTLFRMRTADDVKARLKFHNTGASQVPGVVVMELIGDADNNGTADQAGMNYKRIVVAFNVDKAARNVTVASLAGRSLDLHPAIAASADTQTKSATFTGASGQLSVPARSTVVWVE